MEDARALNPHRHQRIIDLGKYRIDELTEIVRHIAGDEDLLISAQAARLVAEMSQGLPRKVKHWLRMIRLHFPDSEREQVSREMVVRFFRDAGAADRGINPVQKRYLVHLNREGSASLESLAICIGDDRGFVRRQVEPWLLQQGLVTIRSKGRRLTQEGKAAVTKLTRNNRKEY